MQPAYFDSQASAAATLNVDIERIRQAKREGCKAFKSGRVYRKPLVAWLRQHPAVEHSIGYWNALNARLAYDRNRFQFEAEQKRHLPLDQLSSGVGKTLVAFETALNRLPVLAGEKLLGVSDFHSIKEWLQREVDAILETLCHKEYLKDGFTQAIVEAKFSDRDENTKAKVANVLDCIFAELGRRTLCDLLQRELPPVH